MAAQRDSSGRFIKGSGGGSKAGKVIDTDRGMRRALLGLESLDGWQVTVGVHGEDAGGGKGDFSDMDNVALFALQEFGAPGAGIPERSSLRAAFDLNVKKYVKALLLGAKNVSRGRGTPKQAVAIAGEIATADIINLINAGIAPPNAPATIAAKGSSTPLIDTGQMKAAIKPVVSKK